MFVPFLLENTDTILQRSVQPIPEQHIDFLTSHPLQKYWSHVLIHRYTKQ